LVNSDSALKEARASITELKSQLDKTSKALEDATSNNPALKNSLAKLQEENKQWDATATKVENSVATTIQSSAPLVNEAQASADTAKGWGVVFSGDATLDQAKPEIEAARNIGIPNPVIYFRNGWYRGVSLAETRPTA